MRGCRARRRPTERSFACSTTPAESCTKALRRRPDGSTATAVAARSVSTRPPHPRPPPRAAAADKYDLYVLSVQSPDVEVAFFDRAFRTQYGRRPTTLREDFCGPAAVCYEWVRSTPDRRAIGVDLDPEPLAWGVER